MAVQRGLRGLEGSQWVEKVAIRGDKRSFAAAISEKIPVDLDKIRRGSGRPAERIDLSIVGEVSFDSDGATLSCRGSGTKLRLRNRPATLSANTPEDVIAVLREKSKSGTKLFEVAGELVQDGEETVLNLTGARGL